jgi:D-lyxose ketol-isomerase
MKRSELNQIIHDALGFCAERSFALPPFASFTLDDWKARAGEYQEVIDNQMGWDVTDFGTGDFARVGALLFVLRNSSRCEPKYPKPYCEKILIQAEGQVCPLHFHWRKMEDIINRGGGTLILSAYNAISERELDERTPVRLSMDGRTVTVGAGEPFEVAPGESITLIPRRFHEFWAKPGTGKVLVGEVSTITDERTDNNFLRHAGRLPEIEEDAPPEHLIWTDYARLI